MHSGWGKDGGILHVELNNLGQPIGPEAAKLSSNLGVIARNGILAPLNYKDWRLVPDLYKDRIWAHIKENTDAIDDMRRILMMSVGTKWKEWKHEAKRCGYDPFNNDIERLAHRPSRVEEDQWCLLVHYWSSNEAKEKSERNKESRKQLTMPHTSGRKSLPQIIDDFKQMKKENGVKPTRFELFKRIHTKKSKEPVNAQADEVMKDMDLIAKEYPELNVPRSAPNDVYAQVMGPDTHGTVRTLGKGAAPSFVYGPVCKQSQFEQRDFDARVEIEVQKAMSSMQIEMEKKISEAKEEMKLMEKNLSEEKEEIETMREIFSKAKTEMEAKIDSKVKAGMRAYLDMLDNMSASNGKSINNEEVSDDSNEDYQQLLSPISVSTNKVSIKKRPEKMDSLQTKERWKYYKTLSFSFFFKYIFPLFYSYMFFFIFV